MNTKAEQAEDVLVAYYDALTDAKTTSISRFFDSTVTVITLSGSFSVCSPEEIDALYKRLCDTWAANGLSTKIGYDRSHFVTAEIQENAKIVQTRLTNFTKEGKAHQTWDCTYVLCEKPDGWKISLATSNNKTTATASFR